MQIRSVADRASLSDEQAALRREASLRRIATLVAGGVTAGELFSAVAREVSVVLDVPVVTVGRYELDSDSPVSVVLASREHASFPVGSRWPLDGAGTREIYESRCPIRIEDFDGLDGTLASAARRQGMSWVVGAPIIVDGAVWGNIYAGTAADEPIPDDAESRLADFTDLVSTAIANSQAHEQLAQLADKQAALRRVATLVAEGSPSTDVFAAVAGEVAVVLGVSSASVSRFLAGGVNVVLASLNDPGFPVGSRWHPDKATLNARLLETGRPVRIDQSAMSGPIADASRVSDVQSVVGAPIVVEGKVWGMVAVGRQHSDEPLPADTEARLTDFTELIATAISNAEAHDALAELAEEQAALRRVATLVAEGAPPTEVLDAVAVEVGRLIGADLAVLSRYEHGGGVTVLSSRPDGIASELPVTDLSMVDPESLTAAVLRTGRPNRIDDFAEASGPWATQARELGYRSAVGAPVTVEGRLWGVMIVTSTEAHHWAPDTEHRLAAFTELLGTAIANTESRGELAASETRARGLAEEQAALRRVATLVAGGAAADDLFAAVAREVANLFGVGMVNIDRYEDGESVVLASFDDPGFPVGSRWPLDGSGVRTMVYESGRSARVDDFTGVTGTAPAAARASGIKSAVAAPIVVEGRVWGVLGFGWKEDEPLPADTERRLAAFTELVATAIANTESRSELAASEARARELAEEQAALRRVATLVAQGATPFRVFDAVRDEVARMFEAPVSTLYRFDADGMATVLASAGTDVGRVGDRWPLEGTSTAAVVYRTGRTARVDYDESARGAQAKAAVADGARQGVGAPIVVDGALWGSIMVASRNPAPLPAELEHRLAKFTELLATAIANAENRADLTASEARARELANEQAALRRVATLVAQGASPDDLFSAVAKEVAGVIDVPVVGINRYEADGTYTIVGNAGESSLWIGTRWPVADEGLTGRILATGRPSRQDDFIGIRGTLGDPVGDAQTRSWREMRSVVGVPIIVEGSIWGIMSAASAPGTLVPAGTEERLARFTELVATAVSNATTRTDLLTSRARLVSSADESRRRLERDLHDGIQQWLVALALKARKAAGLTGPVESASQTLSGLADDLVAVTDELREISRGIHPAILSDAGLDEALNALARRSAIPVDVDVCFQGRYDPTLEATVYYVAAESITNAVKHAQASRVAVRGGRRDGSIEVEISDDGIGGADPRRGSGMIGLKDRVDTLGGTISFASPAGAGTTIRVKLPAGLRDTSDEAASTPASG